MAAPDLVTLEEAQKALNTTRDISSEIARVSGIIYSLVGPIIHEPVTEYMDGGHDLLFPSHFPIKEGSVTITDRITGEDMDDFFLEPETGIIHMGWTRPGFSRWEVSYTAGYAEPTPDGATETNAPEAIKKAAFLLLEEEISGGGGAASGIKRETIGDWSAEYFGGDEAAAVTGAIDKAMTYLDPFLKVKV